MCSLSFRIREQISFMLWRPLSSAPTVGRPLITVANALTEASFKKPQQHIHLEELSGMSLVKGQPIIGTQQQ